MRILWKIIFSPFRFFWGLLNFIRECILNLFLLIAILIMISIYLQFNFFMPSVSKSALIINFSGTIVDKPTIDNKFRQIILEYLGTSKSQLQENSLFDIVHSIRQAKKDVNIIGLVLLLKNFVSSDQTSLQYIGKALHEFRKTGKPIYAIGDNYSQAQYFLASYANKIYLTPQGSVNLHGISTNNFYYKSLLNKLKVNSHIFRAGTYKSAVEPFIRDDMSDEARNDDSRWIKQLWKNYVDIVANNRKIHASTLFPDIQKILASFRQVNGDTAQFALNNKWIDVVMSRSDIENEMIKIFGWNKKNKTFNSISIYDYQIISSSNQEEKIAVIFVNGAIIDGPKIPGSIGGDTTADQIRKARLNPNVKAIVLRVNSPGGSLSASEVIRSELAASTKPVVVSMGSIAASGGYWISTPANVIIASPSTLTGSIGVFGIVNTVENTLDAIGVHTDGISTSPLANLSITKSLPNEISQVMQINIKKSYENFITLVAKSRHKTIKEIENISQGHVWIGSDALRHGLVDKLGDFDDAISTAAKLAKLKQYQLDWYVDEYGIMEVLLTQINIFTHSSISSLFRSWMPISIYQMVNLLKIDSNLGLYWNDPKNHYAFCFAYSKI